MEKTTFKFPTILDPWSKTFRFVQSPTFSEFIKIFLYGEKEHSQRGIAEKSKPKT